MCAHTYRCTHVHIHVHRHEHRHITHTHIQTIIQHSYSWFHGSQLSVEVLHTKVWSVAYGATCTALPGGGVSVEGSWTYRGIHWKQMWRLLPLPSSPYFLTMSWTRLYWYMLLSGYVVLPWAQSCRGKQLWLHLAPLVCRVMCSLHLSSVGWQCSM